MIVLNGKGTLYKQLYRSLRNAIIEREFSAGEKLPSSRELSKSLQISRNIVVSCYEQLTAEGYIVTQLGSGSFVNNNNVEQKQKPLTVSPQSLTLSQSAKTSLKHWRQNTHYRTPSKEVDINFRYGLVDINRQLQDDINRLTRKSRNTLDSSYHSPAGLLRLRESIARYTQQHRGCRCSADNIVITNGSQQALDLLARLLINPNDSVIVEDPGYLGAVQAFSTAGAKLIHSSVDENGLQPDNFPEETGHSNVRIIYTTPSHQMPTGAILSLPRRLQLLDWAVRNNAYIIEDDYDSEFRYQGRPIESIQGLDQSNQTIYISSFSKLLSPALRIGYVILPDALLDPFTALKWCSDRQNPMLTQNILADFLDSPLFGRHLKRMRKLYGKRRDTLIQSLNKYMGEKITIQGTNAGIHLLVWLNTIPIDDEQKLIQLAAAKGLGIYSATALHHGSPKKLALLIGYGVIPTEQIEKGIKALAECCLQVEKQVPVVL